MAKLRPEVELKSSGGMLDLFDNLIKEVFNITDDEYDYIAEHMSDEECSAFVNITTSETTFSEKRAALEVKNKYLKLYNEN